MTKPKPKLKLKSGKKLALPPRYKSNIFNKQKEKQIESEHGNIEDIKSNDNIEDNKNHKRKKEKKSTLQTSKKESNIKINNNKELKQDNVNKKHKINFKKIYKKLHRKFPKIFNLKEPVIFKLGIHKDLKEILNISMKNIKLFLIIYFVKSKYYKKHVEGAIRFNLKGEECGFITKKQEDSMSQKLVQIRKIKQANLASKTKDDTIVKKINKNTE
jgi:hypothetical protein